MTLKTYHKEDYNGPEEIRTYYHQYSNHFFAKETNNDTILEMGMPEAFYDLQKNLLKQVINLHIKEKSTSQAFKSLIQDHFQINSLKEKFQGTYSLHDIYYIQEAADFYFVGDIHSDAFAIQVILDKIDFFHKIHEGQSFKIIFLGDYIDRGHQHLKTLQDLMILKIMFPENIYFLTGNHDIGSIEDNKVTLYLKKMEEDMAYFYLYIQALSEKDKNFSQELKALYLEFMNHLNIMAFIITPSTCIKAVHGGIPRPDESEGFDYLNHHEQFTDDSIDHLKFRIRDCVLWSDPSIQHNQPTKENKRFKFYENQLINFQEHLGFDTLVRGHQAVEEGYLELFNHKIYTIFSSGQILENNLNINKDTAYDFVMPKVLKYDYKKGLPMNIIDLNA